MLDEYSLLLYFVAQIVKLMAQLKINVFNKYKDNPSCTIEVKKLPLQKNPFNFLITKVLK